MYSIMIVDDERFTRDGIAKLVPWYKCGIDRVDTAESGQRALEMMKKHVPDIMLTDLEMGNMHGIELIKQINSIYPEIRIIVLTAHDNFSYVQECCRMEVQDYLLKPVNPEEIFDIVLAQVQMLEEKKKEKKQEKMLNRIHGISEQMRVEKIFQAFLHEKQHGEEVKQFLQDYGYHEGDSLQVVVLSQGDSSGKDWQEHDALMKLSIKNVCIELIDYQRHGITIEDSSGMLLVILFLGSDHPEGVDLMERINTILKEEYDITVKAILGSKVEDIAVLVLSYQDALEICERTSEENVIQCRTEQNRSKLINSICVEFEKEMKKNLTNRHRLHYVFRAYYNATQSYNMSLELTRRTCFQLLSNVYFTWISEMDGTGDVNINNLADKLCNATKEEIFQIGKDFLDDMVKENNKASSDVIGQAKEYIQEHLEEPLSVAELAERYFLSTAYFSKLFKKNAGVGCNTYIIQQRVEKAKRLFCSSDMQVSQVAEKVGYKDVNYFSLTFRKWTGYTPVEYRQHNKTNGE